MESGKKYEGSWRIVDKFFVRPTGTWGDKAPVINVSKCSQCGWCYLYCPTGCLVEKENYFVPNLDYCKGCGICARECPVNAIKMVKKEK